MHPVKKLFASNEMVFKENMAGISHNDSIVQPEACNCINWIVGHIVYARNGIMTQLKQPQVTDTSFKTLYDRYTKMLDTSTAVHLDKLKELYTSSQVEILNGIDTVNDEQAMDKVVFLGFHEAYHIGQIGIIRKLIGKESAIK